MVNENYWTDTEKEFLAAAEEVIQAPLSESFPKIVDTLSRVLKNKEFCSELSIEEQALICCLPSLLRLTARAVAGIVGVGLPERVYTLIRHPRTPATRVLIALLPDVGEHKH